MPTAITCCIFVFVILLITYYLLRKACCRCESLNTRRIVVRKLDWEENVGGVFRAGPHWVHIRQKECLFCHKVSEIELIKTEAITDEELAREIEKENRAGI